MPALDEVVREIWVAYHERAPEPGNVCDLLAEDHFWDKGTSLIEVAVGPSPHVAWYLLRHLTDHDYWISDWRGDWLQAHAHVYQDFAPRDYPQTQVRPYWLLNDPLREPYVLRDKAVLAHGILPRRTRDSQLVLPFTTEEMAAAVGGLLDAQPARLALYSFGEHPEYPETPSRISAALDSLGVPYMRHDDVPSAHFTPQPGGTLFLLAP